MLHLKGVFRTWEVNREELKRQVLHLLLLHGKVPWVGDRMLGGMEEWTRVSQRE